MIVVRNQSNPYLTQALIQVVTGGVYRVQELIHRIVMIRDY